MILPEDQNEVCAGDRIEDEESNSDTNKEEAEEDSSEGWDNEGDENEGWNDGGDENEGQDERHDSKQGAEGRVQAQDWGSLWAQIWGDFLNPLQAERVGESTAGSDAAGCNDNEGPEDESHDSEQSTEGDVQAQDWGVLRIPLQDNDSSDSSEYWTA
ncbi:hypothetical protein PM082_012411 [Marasmius tenuissimus]|nr:hypothetical protein PM082_012411 [Marasmius tenuissimus]